MITRRWAAAWGGVVAAAFVNGALHRGYAPALGEPLATRVSEVVLPVLVVPWVLRVERHHPLGSLHEAVLVGAAWAGATVTFEFLFGHYVNGDTWSTLLAAYDLTGGHLWSLDVLAIAAAPALARSWHRRRTGVEGPGVASAARRSSGSGQNAKSSPAGLAAQGGTEHGD